MQWFQEELINTKDFSEASAYTYMKKVESLIKLEQKVEQCDQEAVERALIQLMENNFSEATIKAYFTALKHYSELKDQEVNIPNRRNRPKKRRQPRILNEEELSLLNKYFSSEDKQIGLFLSARNKLLVEIPLFIPVLTKELLALSIDSINLDKEEIIFENRTLRMKKELVETAAQYMYFRENLQNITDEPALFLNQHHKKLKPNGAQHIMRYIGKKVGITGLTLETIRETRIYYLLKSGLNELEIALLAGIISYFKIDTIKKYLSNEVTDEFFTLSG